MKVLLVTNCLWPETETLTQRQLRPEENEVKLKLNSVATLLKLLETEDTRLRLQKLSVLSRGLKGPLIVMAFHESALAF